MEIVEKVIEPILIAGIRICVNYRGAVHIEGISVRELTGGRCLSCQHHGSYETLSESYGLIFDHSKSIGMKINFPIREIYIKGPGMIFRGNPKKHITEIQFPFED